MISAGFENKFMAKRIAGQCCSLSIFWLKRQGYFNNNYQSGSINWSCNGESRGGMGISVKRENINSPTEQASLNLRYTHTDYWSKEKSDMDYNIRLEATPCNYGGKRYWFICPLSVNGQYCGRRVGVIYSIGKWFGCRRCGQIAYSSQMRGGSYRGTSFTYPILNAKKRKLKVLLPRQANKEIPARYGIKQQIG